MFIKTEKKLLLSVVLSLLSAQLPVLAVAANPPSSMRSCAIFHDRVASQLLRVEAHGKHGVRVRAVQAGGSFRDDLVSALVPPVATSPEPASCGAGDAAALETGGSVTSGNLNATVLADGRLRFTRISDGRLLLEESRVRALVPTITVPPMPHAGFLELSLEFKAAEGERIFGLGQHKTGKLDNKGVTGLTLDPHNTELLVPVAHSSLGYTFLFNLPAFGAVEYNDTGSYWRADAVLQADMWIATTADGPDHAVSPWQQLQHTYADATGELFFPFLAASSLVHAAHAPRHTRARLWRWSTKSPGVHACRPRTGIPAVDLRVLAIEESLSQPVAACGRGGRLSVARFAPGAHGDRLLLLGANPPRRRAVLAGVLAGPQGHGGHSV